MTDTTQAQEAPYTHEQLADDLRVIKTFSELARAAQGPVLPPEQEKIIAPWRSPPESWADRASYEFAGFIMHMHEDNCLGCGAVIHWSDVFRAYRRKNDPKSARMLPMTYEIPKGAGITVFSIPVRHVPVCCKCVTSTQDGSAVYLVSDEAAWNEARRREDLHAIQQRRSATAARNKEYTPVDLNSVPEGI